MIEERRASNIDVKKINKTRIFRYIFSKEKTSHQEVANKLDVSVPTVLQNIKELLALGLVRDNGAFSSTGGRKARAISPIADARYSLGLDITANHLGMVMVDLTGRVLKHTRMHYPFSAEEAYFRGLGEILKEFVASCEAPTEKILGLGIAVPGIVDADEKFLLYSHILGISDFPCERFTEFISYPCRFLNDANAAGFAEFRNSEVKNTIYLSLSNSVGGSIFLGGKIYLGENMRSGEFGHSTLIPNGKKCYCGKRGCLDAYCSAKILSNQTEGKLALFFEKMDQGDPVCMTVWEKYSEYLSFAVNSLRMNFDCDVILGGYVGSYMEAHIPELKNKLKKLNTFENDAEYLKACQFKQEAAAVGVALSLVEDFIACL